MEEPLIRVLYTGPPIAGCTTSLEQLFRELVPASKYEGWAMRDGRPSPIRMREREDRRLSVQVRHDYRGSVWHPRLLSREQSPQLHAYWDETHAFLKLVDGVVFVVDSQIERMPANKESLESFERDLAEAGRRLADLPFVFQLNKRDCPSAIGVEELRRLIQAPLCRYLESVAHRGEGVLEAFDACLDLVLSRRASM